MRLIAKAGRMLALVAIPSTAEAQPSSTCLTQGETMAMGKHDFQICA